MKKIILTVAAVFAFGFANAQEEAKGEGFSKGDVFISGSVGFSSNDNKATGVKTDMFNVTPRAAYFVTENIAVGLSLGFAQTKEADDKATEFKVGAFGRYYFTPASKFSVFGQLGFDYFNNKVETSTPLGSVEAKSNGFDVAVAPGVSYFVSKNFALEATFGRLGYRTSKPDGGEATNNFGLNVDLSNINLGLVYKF